jgi:hydroxyacylglutathione hydrolase
VLAGQPEPPKYFAEMKRINKQGPRVLHGFQRPERLPGEQLEAVLATGALVVDTRPAAAFAGEHVPGTINIPLNNSFNTWAGWLVPFDRAFHLIVEATHAGALDEAVRDLAMIGLDRVEGYFDASAVEQWATAGGTLQQVRQTSVRELSSRMRAGDVAVLDVRGAAEWEAGHLPGVPNIPLGYLIDRLDEVPRDRPLVLHCQSGARSAIAASLLQARGFTNVVNLAGGIVAWQQDGQPVEQEAEALAGTP